MTLKGPFLDWGTSVLSGPRRAPPAVPPLWITVTALSLFPFPPYLHRGFVPRGLILSGVIFQVCFQFGRLVDLALLPTADSAFPVDSYLLPQRSPPGTPRWARLGGVGHTSSALTLLLTEHIQVRLLQSGIICISLVVINISLISQLQ